MRQRAVEKRRRDIRQQVNRILVLLAIKLRLDPGQRTWGLCDRRLRRCNCRRWRPPPSAFLLRLGPRIGVWRRAGEFHHRRGQHLFEGLPWELERLRELTRYLEQDVRRRARVVERLHHRWCDAENSDRRSRFGRGLHE